MEEYILYDAANRRFIEGVCVNVLRDGRRLYHHPKYNIGAPVIDPPRISDGEDLPAEGFCLLSPQNRHYAALIREMQERRRQEELRRQEEERRERLAQLFGEPGYIAPEQSRSSDTVVIPEIIRRLITGNGGFYERQYKNIFGAGQGKTDDELRNYLGTYFPRSFAESYLIYSDLFSVGGYAAQFDGRDTFSVLDAGCGTGGELFGLAVALMRHLPGIRRMDIRACDACDASLAILRKLTDDFLALTDGVLDIRLRTERVVFMEDGLTFDGYFGGAGERYDAILSFKVMNEIIRRGAKPDPAPGRPLPAKDKYDFSLFGALAAAAAPCLSPCGTLTILDVTSPMAANTYNKDFLSEYMNRHLNDFILSDAGLPFCFIAPLPCALHLRDKSAEPCSCFMQRYLSVFSPVTVSDGDARLEKTGSKVIYRVIAREPMFGLFGLEKFKRHTFRTVYKGNNFVNSLPDRCRFYDNRYYDFANAYIVNQ